MWSKNFNKCQRCGTDKIKHKAKGLCLICYEKSNDRKLQKKRAKIKFKLKNLNNERYKQYNYKRNKRWRKNNNDKWNAQRRRWYKNNKIRKEILTNDLSGLSFICDGCNKKCLVISNVDKNTSKKIIVYKIEKFKKQYITLCQCKKY